MCFYQSYFCKNPFSELKVKIEEFITHGTSPEAPSFNY